MIMGDYESLWQVVNVICNNLLNLYIVLKNLVSLHAIFNELVRDIISRYDRRF